MSGYVIYPPEECPHPAERVAAATSTAPAQCASCGTIEPDAKAVNPHGGCAPDVDAKAVDRARVEVQVNDQRHPGTDAKAVNSGGGSAGSADAKAVNCEDPEAGGADAKAVNGGESLFDFLQRALGITLPAPPEPNPAPMTPPRQAADIYADAHQINPWAGEDYGSSIFWRPQGQQPLGLGHSWHQDWGRDTFTPGGEERAAELDKARRRGARRVARIARNRAHGIRPCCHGVDR